MGSGKTTVGKALAQELELSFLDLDKAIEESSGKQVAEVFDSDGEEAFRKLEKMALNRTVAIDNTVIATGGGTPCFNNNMNLMNETGLTIYLKLSMERLFERLKEEQTNRPLLKGLQDEKLKEFIAAELDRREPYYRQAQYTVAVKDTPPLQLAHFIAEQFSLA